VFRIAVDCRALSDGSQHRGIGTYVRGVLAALADTNDLAPIALAEASAALGAGVSRHVTVRRGRHHRVVYREHDWRLPRDLDHVDADLLHSPAQHPPRRCLFPWVQTVHDLTPLTFNDPRFALDRQRWMRYGPRLTGAAAIIAVSTHSANVAIETFDLDPATVRVIPLAPAEEFVATPAPIQPPHPVAPYLLHVGGWGPHKGFDELVGVIDRVAAAGLPHRLVIAGAQDPWMRTRVEESISHAAHPERVEVAGYVDDIVALYQGASALVYTSRAEGFGLPLVEAMAAGLPLVAFDNTCIAEVVGHGGIVVRDGSITEMSDATRALVEDETIWMRWSAAGRSRAREFSWKRTFDAHADLFRELLG
jgi:glycosyltransferase involved in cell wall biosynthesis